jgi:hypothetical protein
MGNGHISVPDADCLLASADDFNLTLCELEQLALYWYRRWWQIRLFDLYSQTRGGETSGIGIYCRQRIERLKVEIGAEAFQEVAETVDVEVRKAIGEEDWAAITGTDKAYRRFVERVESKLHPAW